MRRAEALVKGVGSIVLLVVLGAAGIPGFSVIAGLIILGGSVLVVVAACFLVIRSPLRGWKRAGLCVFIVGAFLCVAWYVVKPPPEWPQEQGLVTRLIMPPCTVQTDYTYTANGNRYKVTMSKDWPSVAAAQRAKSTPLALFCNPQRLQQWTERPTSSWVRVQAVPVDSRLIVQGPYKATVQFGAVGLFGANSAEFEGANLASLTPGKRLPVYIDPADGGRVSLVPQATVGGRKYPLLAFGLTLIATGLVVTFKDRKWLETPAIPLVAATAPPIQPTASHPRPLNAREQLERIDWRQFERVVARILEHMEWQATLSGGAKPDGGADIVARRNGEIAVVQCKHWKRTMVQLRVVRELLGTKASAGFAAHEAVLFTSSTYTDEARKFAAENKITLFDGADVTKHIEAIGVQEFPELVDPDRKFCPKCDAPMVRRESARPFWGCSTYPRCRGTIEIETL